MQQNLIQNKDIFPDTHHFIYKEKQYPIKYSFFKLSSKYFSTNSTILKKNKDIQLIDKELEQNINISEQSINDFIKYVHHEPVMLTNDTVIEIDYLAKKYEVSSLLELTTNYITMHHDELSIQLFTFYQNDQIFTTEKYENIISQHFLNYTQDERLLMIPISTLYRIFSKYQEKEPKSTKNNQQIFDFLLKCLDKYGREASVLFSLFDFEGMPNNCLNILLTKYAKTFDFNFINSAIQKTIYAQQSDIIRHQIEIQNKQEEYQNQMKIKMENMREEYMREIALQKKDGEENSKKTENEISKIRSEFEEKLTKQREEYERELALQKKDEEENSKKTENEISKIRSEFEEKLTKQREEYEREINSLKKEIKEQKDKIDKMNNQLNEKINDITNKSQVKSNVLLYFGYDEKSQNCFSGIIHHLTEACGGNVHQKGMVNVTSSSGNNAFEAVNLENTESYFQTSRAAKTPNMWLKYDFKNIKIRPTHYSIRSRHDGDQGYYHPKSWVIEASNTGNDNDWKILDSQNGVSYLDGRRLTHTFKINQTGSNEYYRFIRFRQTDKNTGGNHDIRLSALEYFGYMFTEID